MSPSNQVWLSDQAFAAISGMRRDVLLKARGLIVILAASPLDRLPGRLDIGLVNPEGLRIWAYEDTDFWLYYTEETDGSFTVVRIWER